VKWDMSNRIEYKYKTQADFEFGQLSSVLEWCKSNCGERWGYFVLSPSGREAGSYEFWFADERDLINFILWKK